jgi:uncharacterized protein (DUF2336 family)
MMVRAYLEWSATATAAERAEAVGILADVYLGGELDASTRRDAEAALLLALDDPAPVVRRALAVKLAASDHAPRALVAALSQDVPEIAAIVAAHSPLLPDAALVDLLALGGDAVQVAVAGRASLSLPVAAAMAEVGCVAAVEALIANPHAAVSIAALRRIVDRFPEDAPLRELLLARTDLPADIRLALVRAAAVQLSRFAGACGWLSEPRAARLAQECAESGAVTLAAEAAEDELPALARSLAQAGALTPQLLLRSLLSGDAALLTVALAQLAGVTTAKAAGLVQARGGSGFLALYRKAGLPLRLAPAFEAALAAWREGAVAEARPGALSRAMVERVLTSVAALDERENDRLMALLLRYQAEAAREEARAAVKEMLAEPAAPAIELEPPDLEMRLREALVLEFKEAA